jgi:hypothetical protein
MALRTKPREVTVSGTGHDVNGHEAAAVIPVRELQEARKETEWLMFREAALAERQELREQGRSS